MSDNIKIQYRSRKIKKSFKEWCTETNHDKYLELWDYEKNNIDPDLIGYTNWYNDCYFKCPDNLHESFGLKLSNLIHSKDLICPICNSFKTWCENTNNKYIIDLWDTEKNDISIDMIAKSSGKKFYFKCERGLHDSYLLSLSDIYAGKFKKIKCPKCNSIGQYLLDLYGADAIEKYWSEKNTKSPFEYPKSSKKKVWIKCVAKDYHDDYLAECGNFINGNRCPWCAHKLLHPKDSFGQHVKNVYGEDFFEKYWCKENTINPYKIAPYTNDLKVKIQCQKKSYHQFWQLVTDVSSKKMCPYCNRNLVHPNDSLGSLYPEIVPLWSDKNDKSPFEYKPFSHYTIWLKCENETHEEYQRKISDYTRKVAFLCPICHRERHESSYETAVREYLETLHYTINHEYNCSIIPRNPNTNYPLPYDNEIEDIKLIIEVHGAQHYKLSGFHITAAKSVGNKTPQEMFEYQLWKDKYKKDYAIENGYSYLEIPYTSVLDNTYINLIDSKIKQVA